MGIFNKEGNSCAIVAGNVIIEGGLEERKLLNEGEESSYLSPR
jgi:hypothetical protein